MRGVFTCLALACLAASVAAQQKVLVLDYEHEQEEFSTLSGAPFSFGGASFTVEGWFFLKRDSPRTTLWHLGDEFAQYLALGIDLQRKLEFCIRSSPTSDGIDCVATSRRVPRNLWTHIAVVYEAGDGRARILLDGVVQAAGSGLPQPPLTQRKLHLWGGHPIIPQTGMSGLLDEVRIWSVARSDNDIRAGMQGGLPPGTSGLEVQFEFEASSNGWSVQDTSGHSGRQGTVNCAFLKDACIVELTQASKSVCGDGKRGAFEGCDDGNAANGDGCSAACTTEPGYLCFQGSPGGTDLCILGTTLDFQRLDDPATAAATWSFDAGPRPGADSSVSSNARYDGQRGVRLYQPPMLAPVSEDTLPADGRFVWLQASKGVTLAGDHVTRWADQSGHGHDMIVPPIGARLGPTLAPADETDLNSPAIRFDVAETGQALQFESDSVRLEFPYTVVLLFRHHTVLGGRLMHSRDHSTFFIGPNSGYHGVYLPNIGYVTMRDSTAQTHSYGRELSSSFKWYLLIGSAGPGKYNKAYQNGKLVGDNRWTQSYIDPGRIAFSDMPGVSHANKASGEISEFIMYNRTLSEDEIADVHRYFAETYNLPVSPSLPQSRDTYLNSPSQFHSFASSVLTGPVTSSTYLRFAAQAAAVPRRWGMPLWVAVFEDLGGPAPQPWDCTGRALCNSRRFFSICFSSGSTEAMHCDETRDVPEATWETVMLHIWSKFASKYRQDFDGAGPGTEPFNPAASVRFMAAAVPSDDAAEAFVDEVHLLTIDTLTPCPETTVVSVGGASYAMHVLADMPHTYMRLGAGFVTEQTTGVDGMAVGGSAAPFATNQAYDADGAWEGDVASDYVQGPSMPPGKVPDTLGFSVEFWVRVAGPAYGNASTSPTLWSPLVSDRAGPGSWTFRFELGSDLRLRFGINTDLGANWITTDEPISIGQHFFAAEWQAITGRAFLYVDGQEPPFDTVSHNGNVFRRNVGVPVYADNPLRVGFDGEFSPGGHPLKNSVVVDEVAVFPEPKGRGVFASRFHRTVVDHANDPLVEVAGQPAHSLARLVHNGVQHDAAATGLSFWKYSSTGALLSGTPTTFDITNPDSDVAQAEIDAAADFLMDEAEVPVNSSLAAALAWPVDAPQPTIYMDDFRINWPSRIMGLRSIRFTRSTNDAVLDMNREVAYYIQAMDSNPYPAANKTWEGAKDFCERHMGQRLCRWEDVCLHNDVPSGKQWTSSVMTGYVSGEGWMPVADEPNLWVSVGTQFHERRCRSYAWVSEHALVFDHDRQDYPTWTQAPPRSGVSCCGRNGPASHFKVVNEYPNNTAPWRMSHTSVTWQFNTQGLQPRSYYYAYPVSPPYNCFSTPSTCSAACSHRLRGTIALLDIPAAYDWTDYTVEVWVYANARQNGIVFRWTDEDHHYKFMLSPYVHERCTAFTSHSGPDDERVLNTSVTGNRRWRDDDLHAGTREWMNVRVDVYGNHFAAYLNDRLVNNWTDPTSANTKGTIGFFTAYSAYSQFRHLRVYRRKPLNAQKLNSALLSLSMPPVPIISSSGVGVQPTARFGYGASYAAIGRRVTSYSNASAVGTLYGTGWRTSAEIANIEVRKPNITFDMDTLPVGQLPASSLPGPGDGHAVARTVLGCTQQSVTIPENSAPGSILPIPVFASATTGATVTDFRISGLEKAEQQAALSHGASSPLRDRAFMAFPEDGTLAVRRDVLDFEAKRTHRFAVSAGTSKWDSGWFTMIGMCPDNPMFPSTDDCYREVEFPEELKAVFWTKDPSKLDVQVQLRVADGPNQGYIFTTMGAAPWDEYATWSYWGGMVSGYSRTHLRLWAPSLSYFGKGAIINLGVGSGAVYKQGSAELETEKNVQFSNDVEVRVIVTEASAPDFDSSWFTLNAQEHRASFYFLLHGLNSMPSRVKTMVRADDGPNAGFIFEAKGDGQKYRHYGEYGGIVSYYSEREVRLLAPDARGSESLARRGHSIHIPAGYPKVNRQSSRYSSVRVQAWADAVHEAPDYMTDPDSMAFAQFADMYREHEVVMPKPRPPARHIAFATIGPRAGFMCRAPLVGMHGNLAYTYWSRYSGITWAFNRHGVRGWGPSPDRTRSQWRSTNHVAWRVADGWGGEAGTGSQTFAPVQVQAWSAPSTSQDSAEMTVHISDVQEPPIVENAKFTIAEDVSERNASNGFCLGKLVAADDDFGDTLSYSIISGNVGGAWSINSTADICVANGMAVNYEETPYFVLGVAVTDGLFSNLAVVEIDVLNRNDQVHVYPKNLTIPENTPENIILSAADPTETDEAVPSFDQDLDQTTFYSIVGGNDDGAFSINACSGQVRVNQSVLNFEEQNFYNLTIRVEDDGSPMTWDESWATVHITDRNDPPSLEANTVLVEENSKAGELVGLLGVDDEDNDELYFSVLRGDPFHNFTIRFHSQDPVHGRNRYALYISDDSIDWGDGSGREDTGFVCPDGCVNRTRFALSFEDPDLPSVPPTGKGRNLQIRVQDLELIETNFPNHAKTGFVTVGVIDKNDPPFFDAIVLSVPENSGTSTPTSSPLTNCANGRPCVRDEDADDAGLLTFAMHPDSVGTVPFVVQPNGAVEVDLSVSGLTSLDYEATPLISFNVTVTDSGGPDGPTAAINMTREVAVALTDVQEPPTASLLQSFNVSELAPLGTVVGHLNASDPDEGDSVSYTILDGNDLGWFDVIGENGAVTVVSALDFETTPSVVLHVIASDGALETGQINVTINLIDENDPPFFICTLQGQTDFVLEEDTNAVQGFVSGSSEVASGFETAIFDLTTGSSTFTREDCEEACQEASGFNCVAATYFAGTGPTVYPQASFHGDCFGRTAFQDIRVHDPIAQRGAFSMFKVPLCEEAQALPEHPPKGTVLANITAVDLDSDTAVLSIPLENNPGWAVEVNGTEVVVNNSAAFDYETQPEMLLQVAVFDGTSSAFTWVRATLVDVNEAPTFVGDNSTYSFAVAELDGPGTLVGRLFATDPDASYSLNFTIIGGNFKNTFRVVEDEDLPDTARLELNRTIQSNEADIDGADYTLVLEVSDGDLGNVVEVYVNINATNTAPMLSGLTTTRTVPENSAPGTAVGAPITVTDNEGDQVTFTIISTTPTIPGAAGQPVFDFVETSPGLWNLVVAQAPPRGALNFECDRTDPLPGCAAGLFHTYNVSFTVSDWGTGNRSVDASLTVSVTNVDDTPEAPSTMVFSVPELSNLGRGLTDMSGSLSNPPAGLGGLRDVYDDDKDPLTFTLSGPDSAAFAVAAGNGDLVESSGDISDPSFLNQYPLGQTPDLTVAAELDFEVKSLYTFTLSVSDGATTLNVAVTVNVTDVLEAPVVDSGLADPATFLATVPENSPQGTLAGMITASDPDGDYLYYVITGVSFLFQAGCPAGSECQEEESAGQFLETFYTEPVAVNDTFGPHDAQNASLFLRAPQPGAGTSVLDYENRLFYRVSIEVADRPLGAPGRLSSMAYLNVTVLDVNDIAIDAVRMTRSNGAGGFVPTDGLRTVGGLDFIEVLGRGIRHEKPGPVPPVISLEYGCEDEVAVTPTSPGDDTINTTCAYTATGCVMDSVVDIRCAAVPGSGAGHRIRITVDGQVRHSTPSIHSPTTPQLVSYLPPRVTDVSAPSPLATAGGQSIVVSGSNFGPSGTEPVSATYANGILMFAATSCSVDSHTQITCQSVAGVGTAYLTAVSVDGQASTSAASLRAEAAGNPTFAATLQAMQLNYAAPVVTGVNATSQQHNQPTSGSGAVRNIALSGTSFGPGSAALIATAMDPGATLPQVQAYVSFVGELRNARFWLRSSDCQHASDNLVECSTPPGTGSNFTWRLTTGEQTSAWSSASEQTGYAAPEITSVFGEGVEEGPTAGGSRVSVQGVNLGPAFLLSKLDESGSELPAFSPIAAVDSLLYTSPFSVLPNHTYAASNCAVRTAHSLIDCVTAPGTGEGHRWTLTVGDQASAQFIPPENTSYAKPFITETLGAAGTGAETRGGQTVVLRGSNLGQFQVAIQRVVLQGYDYGDKSGPLRAYDFTANCVLSVAHVELTCTTPEGAGSFMSFDVVVDGLQSEPASTRYLQPHLDAVQTADPAVGEAARNVTPSTLHTRGGDVFSVQGLNFAENITYVTSMTYSGSYSVPAVSGGGTRQVLKEVVASCNMTAAHHELQCVTLPGVGAGLQVNMLVAGQGRDSESIDMPPVSYAPPELLTVLPSFAASQVSSRDFRLRAPSATTRNVATLPTLAASQRLTVRLVGTNFGSAAEGLTVHAQVSNYEVGSPAAVNVPFTEGNCFEAFDRLTGTGGTQWYSSGFPLADLEQAYVTAVGSPLAVDTAGQSVPQEEQSRSAPYCIDFIPPVENHESLRLTVEVGGQTSASELELSFARPHVGDVIVAVSEESEIGPFVANRSRSAAFVPVTPALDVQEELQGWRMLKLEGLDFGTSGAVVVQYVDLVGNGTGSADAEINSTLYSTHGILTKYVEEMRAAGHCCAAAAADLVASCLEECLRVDLTSVLGGGFYDRNLGAAPRSVRRETTLCRSDVDIVADSIVDPAFYFRPELQFHYRHDSIRCLLPPAGGREITAAVGVLVAGGRFHAYSNVMDFSQLSPRILEVRSTATFTAGDAYRTTGGQTLRLLVEYAGTVDRNVTRIEVGEEGVPPGEQRMPNTLCPIDWSDSQAFLELDDNGDPCGSSCTRSRELAVLTCLMPPGEGTQVPIRVFRGDRASDNAEFVTFLPPTVDSIIPFAGRRLQAGLPAFGTEGGQLAWLQGYNLGILDRAVNFTFASPSMPLAGYTDTAPQTNLSAGVQLVPRGPGLQPWERVLISIPANGVGQDHHVCVTVAGQAACSPTGVFSYAAPEVTRTVNFASISTRGSNGKLWIIGSNFGPAFIPGVTSFSLPGVNYELHEADWNHTHIALTILPSNGGLRMDMSFTVEGQTWRSADVGGIPPSGPPVVGDLTLVNFAQPAVNQSTTDPLVNIPTRGGMNVTIRGTNFGLAPYVELGGVRTTPVESDHEFLTFVVPESVGSYDVVVFANNQPISAPLRLEYAAPSLSSIRVLRGCQQRCGDIVIGGQESAGLYTTPCEEDSVFGGTANVEPYSVWTNRVTADTPEWDRVRRCAQPDRVELRGANFGSPTDGAHVVFNGQRITARCDSIDTPGSQFKPLVPCLMDVLPSEEHDLVKIRAPPGQGAGHSIHVSLPEKVNGAATSSSLDTPAQAIDYLAPEITNQHPRPFRAVGDTLYFFGHGLGHNSSAFPLCTDPAFGLEPFQDHDAMHVSLSGTFNCTSLCWSSVMSPVVYSLPPEGVPQNGLPFLKCEMGQVPRGPHTVEVTVAGQTGARVNLPDTSTSIRSVCDKAWWGMDGEYCLTCPEGAVCENCPADSWEHLNCPDGYRSEDPECLVGAAQQGPQCTEPTTEGGEPVSVKGFWVVQIQNTTREFTDNEVCPPERRGREECPLPLGCLPSFACVGNNECLEGYVDERCSKCKPKSHFRIAGVCKKCPDNPWMPIVGFVAVIIVMCGGSWYVNKKNLSLGMVAIGIDYFQVLAIFAQSNVKWPDILIEFFNIFSYINFNIDVAAPECLTPNLDFRLKWYMQLGLPIGVAAMLALSFVVVYVWKKFIKGQSGAMLTAHLSPCITALVTAMYVLYLLLCRRVFDVFNCNPTVPPDPRGTLYMEATNSPCWEAGSLHMQVLPFAIFGLCFYVIGYPVFVGYFLFKFRETIKEDQHLRAIGANYVASATTGNVGATFRARYSKLYYYFKPSHYWFILTVLGRKVSLAMTSLMFRSNPGFQLAVALLIVFFSFTTSVIVQPYLCAATAEEVMEKHDKMVNLGSRLHQKIDVELRRARAHQSSELRKQKTAGWFKAKDVLDGKGDPDADEKTKVVDTRHLPQNRAANGDTRMAGSILVNYNFVDQLLLANTVLVCLIGLMFESNQFSTDNAANDAATGSLTGVAIFLIMSGTIFYITCFTIDMYANLGKRGCCTTLEAEKRQHGSLRKALVKRLVTNARKKKAAGKKGKKPGKDSGMDALIDARNAKSEKDSESSTGMQMNPMLMKAGHEASKAAANVASLSEAELDAGHMPDEVPVDAVYRAYLAKYISMEKEMAKLSKEFENKDLKESLAAGDAKEGGASLLDSYKSASAAKAAPGARKKAT